MNYAHQYVRSAELICGLYDGSMPLAAFLKQYFGEHKKFGSRDRKRISHLCYCFYRLGHALPELAFAARIKPALFLCEDEPAEWQDIFDEEWIVAWTPRLRERIQFIAQKFPAFSENDIFPWRARLTADAFDTTPFSLSHLVQPKLFLRLRPGHATAVREKLNNAGVPFENRSNTCIALPNGTKIDGIISIDEEAVVQDYSSQRVGDLYQKTGLKATVQAWDCCAASGGKSIMLHDLFPSVELSVSDIRESIIQNLKKRFAKAGIWAGRIFIADLSKPLPAASLKPFDLVICDVPCTGSGTWGRTPEQLYFFKEDKIDTYAALQRRILTHVLPYIKPGGYLLYSTCSVFSKENEAIVETVVPQMEIVTMEWLKGYDLQADSMFAALLQKPGL